MSERGVWAAPGRINLIGEHTDYNGGYVLPFALDRRTTVKARLCGGPPRWSVTTTMAPAAVEFTPADLVPGRITGWAAYVAGVIWALTEAGFDVSAAVLAIDSDVPPGSGLSSSAALECAVLSALCDLGGLDLPLADRPRLAQRAENVYVGVPCGIMDQTAATLCRDGHVLLLDCDSLATEQIACDPSSAGLAVLVIDTRAPHRHVDNEYAARRRACEEAARILGVASLRAVDDLPQALTTLPDPVLRRRVRHVVTENARVLDAASCLRAGRIRDLGPLLTASHISMRDDYEITVPEVDLAVEIALKHGALGARMTGGGFGGCVLAMVTVASVGDVVAAVTQAYGRSGYAPPVSFVARPSRGAYRLM